MSIDGIEGSNLNVQVISVLISTEIMVLNETWLEYEFESKVKSGNLVLDLIKPISIIGMFFFKNLAFLLVNFLIILFPLSAILTYGFSSSILQIERLPMFVLSIFFSIIINFFLSLLIGVASLTLKSVWGVLIFKEALMALFGGILIPLEMYPSYIQRVVQLSPIYGIYQIPQKLLFGFEGVGILFVQLSWIAVLLLITHLYMKRQMSKNTFFGG